MPELALELVRGMLQEKVLNDTGKGYGLELVPGEDQLYAFWAATLDRVVVARSADGGGTWQRGAVFRDRYHSALGSYDLLFGDRRLFLVTATHRHGIGLFASENGGRSWSRERTVNQRFRDAYVRFRAPSLAFGALGDLFVVYDRMDRPAGDRQPARRCGPHGHRHARPPRTDASAIALCPGVPADPYSRP